MLGLLTNLELLADRWGLIDRQKYLSYRAKRDPTGKISNNVNFQTIFDLRTLRLALKGVVCKTADKNNVFIEKEFSFASAKLIQAFQELLILTKLRIEPSFSTLEQGERETQGILSNFLDKFVTGISEQLCERVETPEQLVQNSELLGEYRRSLKNFERMVRVFEMTFIDLSSKLMEDVRAKNFLLP